MRSQISSVTSTSPQCFLRHRTAVTSARQYQNPFISTASRKEHSHWRRLSLKSDVVKRGTRLHASKQEGSAEGKGKATKGVEVVEYFLLIKANPDVSFESVEEMLGAMWSLQYLIPNVLCASAGTIQKLDPGNVDMNLGEGQWDFDRFTHALHFRFSSVQLADAFRQHQTYVQTKSAQMDPMCAELVELVARVEIPNELGNLFKKGGSWEEGLEHVMVLNVTESQQKESLQEFLGVLGELAQSSAGGALQSASGPLGMISGEKSEKSEAKLVLVSHFLSREGVLGFLRLPPVQALFGEGNGWLKVVHSFGFEISPSDSKTQSQGGSRQI